MRGGGREGAAAPTAAPCPLSHLHSGGVGSGCHYPPRLCGVRGLLLEMVPSLPWGRCKQGRAGHMLRGAPRAAPVFSRPTPAEGPPAADPGPWARHLPTTSRARPLRLRSPTLRAWTPTPWLPHTQHWWVLLPGTTHLGHTRTGQEPWARLETLHGATPQQRGPGSCGFTVF